MQTVTIELFKFDELSAEAQQVAIDNYRYSGNHCGDVGEVINSAKAAVELFNLETGNEYSAVRHSHIDDCILELKGIRAYKYLLNNYGHKLFKPLFLKSIDGHKFYTQVICKRYDFTKYGNGLSTFIYSKNRVTDSCVLTGVCYDDDILQPVYDFLAKPCKYTTIQDIFEQLGEAIEKAFADYEDWVNSDEYISDFLEGNEYDFTINGKRY
jgi:hypothetical protein